MVCHRAYRIYADAVGIKRIGKQIRSKFNRAMRKAIEMGVVEEHNDYGTSDQINKVVHIVGTPSVIRRERGDREIKEIPPSEIAEAMREIIEHIFSEEVEDKDVVFRQVLVSYELKRKTQNAIKALDCAWQIYKQQE